jgi:conjugative relaxase-like TrwC/TraI family protein
VVTFVVMPDRHRRRYVYWWRGAAAHCNGPVVVGTATCGPADVPAKINIASWMWAGMFAGMPDAHGAAMISVRTMRGGGDAAGYYLDRAAECAAEYYLGDGEPAGRWFGRGAAALGLEGLVNDAGARVLRQLLDGIDPSTGGRGVGPVMRAHPQSLLPAAELVTAIDAVSSAGANVFAGDAALAHSYAQLAAAVARRPATATVPVDDVAALARAVGLDPVVVFRGADGTDRYAAALAFADVKIDVRNSLIDVTVSAPKSVSVLYGLADTTTAQMVRGCHERAVNTVYTYLDRVAGHGLRGHQGGDQRAHHVGTDGLVAAAFTHRTSRADDPQLHTHLVVPNMVHGTDGQWSAVDSRTIYRHATTASYLYQAVLRGGLTQELGVAWTPIRRGIAEIDGIPTKLRKLFSTRRDQITAYEAERGLPDTPKTAQAACLATRASKNKHSDTTLRERWSTRSREAGHDPSQVVADVLNRIEAPARPALAELITRLTGPDGLTRNKTSIDRRDVLQALCEAHLPGTDLTLRELDSLAELMVDTSDQLLHLAGTGGGSHEPRYSTAELIDTEQHALAAAEQLRGQHAPAVNEFTVTGRLTGTRLTAEQQAVVRSLMNDPSSLAVVIGPAGAGKTAALAIAHRIWTADGVPVVGTAVAALAARGLQRATGIRSDTLTRVLADLDQVDADTGRAAGLPPRSVLVVDEAGMVDTRALTRIFDHALAAQAKVVLVGDPAQLPEIRAGGLFDTLTQHPNALRFSGNVRQTHDWERAALTALRHGDPATALGAYLAHDRVTITPSATGVRDRIVDDYLSRTGRGYDVVILTSTRAGAAALNAAVRDRLREQRQLGADRMTVSIDDASRSFALGDQVIVTANDHRRGLLNGTRGTVMSVTPYEMCLRTDDGRQVNLDQPWVATGRLDHGYALTVHKAQGTTVDTALVHGTDALTKEAGYVALSRGRHANHIYATATDALGAIDAFDDDQAASVRETIGDLATRLSQSRRHRLATEQIGRDNYLTVLRRTHPIEPQTRSVSR